MPPTDTPNFLECEITLSILQYITIYTYFVIYRPSKVCTEKIINLMKKHAQESHLQS